MSIHLTTQQIGLIFMLVGAVSVVLNEQLARLDFAFCRSEGPYLIEQARMRTARGIIVGTGVALFVLAAVLVRG